MGKESWLQSLLYWIKYNLHICQQDGCWERNAVPCFLPDYDAPDGRTAEPSYYYCTKHCHTQGFCWGCGTFWGGVNDFDFAPSGLCEHCRSEYEDDDYDEEDDDYAFAMGMTDV